jgi:hypothetical protein
MELVLEFVDVSFVDKHALLELLNACCVRKHIPDMIQFRFAKSQRRFGGMRSIQQYSDGRET